MKKVDVVLGMQWGDEGKGKIVDVLTPRYEAVLLVLRKVCVFYCKAVAS